MWRDGRTDNVSIRIKVKLINLPRTPRDPCIFKLHHQLRQVNEKAYEPLILAIGPYHHGKDGLQVMEEQKLRYLQQLLGRRNESSLETYVMALRGLQQRARDCYAESVSLSEDEFVEMMLLDGCFIIELFHKRAMVVPMDRCDPIFKLDWIYGYLGRDLMLFENQLPFFVLTALFNMIKVPDRQYNLRAIALLFLKDTLPDSRVICAPDENSSNEIKHLLGLKYNTMIPSFGNVGETEKWAYIHCATELQEAGVKFKKLERGNMFDIKFKNGVIEIPPLKIYDETECFFRNLIAYEQYSEGYHFNYFTDYMTFMDSLINSSKDVELLRRKGIIENWLGDDEKVSTMFNKLGDHVAISNFYYAKLFNEVNEHCNKRWNVRMAKLRRNYFNSPWALLSVLAAVLLLVLTIVQTIFSVLSYFLQ